MSANTRGITLPYPRLQTSSTAEFAQYFLSKQCQNVVGFEARTDIAELGQLATEVATTKPSSRPADLRTAAKTFAHVAVARKYSEEQIIALCKRGDPAAVLRSSTSGGDPVAEFLPRRQDERAPAVGWGGSSSAAASSSKQPEQIPQARPLTLDQQRDQIANAFAGVFKDQPPKKRQKKEGGGKKTASSSVVHWGGGRGLGGDEPMSFFRPTLEVRDYQIAAVNAVMQNQKNICCVVLPCGAGKTLIGYEICKRLLDVVGAPANRPRGPDEESSVLGGPAAGGGAHPPPPGEALILSARHSAVTQWRAQTQSPHIRCLTYAKALAEWAKRSSGAGIFGGSSSPDGGGGAGSSSSAVAVPPSSVHKGAPAIEIIELDDSSDEEDSPGPKSRPKSGRGGGIGAAKRVCLKKHLQPGAPVVSLGSGLKVIVVDEAHIAPAEKVGAFLAELREAFPKARTVCLTATLLREAEGFRGEGRRKKPKKKRTVEKRREGTTSSAVAPGVSQGSQATTKNVPGGQFRPIERGDLLEDDEPDKNVDRCVLPSAASPDPSGSGSLESADSPDADEVEAQNAAAEEDDIWRGIVGDVVFRMGSQDLIDQGHLMPVKYIEVHCSERVVVRGDHDQSATVRTPVVGGGGAASSIGGGADTRPSAGEPRRPSAGGGGAASSSSARPASAAASQLQAATAATPGKSLATLHKFQVLEGLLQRHHADTILILVESRELARKISFLLGVCCVDGSVSKKHQDLILNKLRSEQIRCVVAVHLFDESCDVPNLTVIIQVGAGFFGSRRQQQQRAGRLRRVTAAKRQRLEDRRSGNEKVSPCAVPVFYAIVDPILEHREYEDLRYRRTVAASSEEEEDEEVWGLSKFRQKTMFNTQVRAWDLLVSKKSAMDFC